MPIEGEPDLLFVEGAILAAIASAFTAHDAECEREPYLILLNQGNFELLGWDEVYGLPVLPDHRVPPMRCRLVCGTHGWAGSHDGERVVWIDGEAFVYRQIGDEPLN